MDTNQNLEQVNTFDGGMNLDTSDALLQNNQYRYAENLRFVSHDTDNTGEIQPIKNAELRFTLDDIIIATTQIRDYAIFITVDKDNYWSIWTINKNNSNRKKIFGPCKNALGNSVSLVSRWETDKDVKLYIADGKHQLMYINILHTDYDKNGNPPTNIKYVLSTAKVILTQPEVQESNTSGSLEPAVVQYTYRLYKDGGSVTEWAPISKPITLIKDDGRGYAKEETTDKSIYVSINIDDTAGLDKIQIIRITHVQNGQDPQIYCIYDGKFIDHILDAGQNVVSFSKSEFQKSYTYDAIIPHEIESKGDYLFAGNVRDLQDEIDSQWAGIDFTNREYIDIDWYQEETPKYQLNIDGTIRDGEAVPSLMPGETYRYGIILYDKDGRKSSVKHVCDITIPQYTDVYEIKRDDSQYYFDWDSDRIVTRWGVAYYDIKPIGVNIKIKKSIENCSKYEIVRCIRTIDQKRILYQGISGLPEKIESVNKMFHPGLLSDIDNKKYIKNTLLFACPEYSYLPEETKAVLKNRSIQITDVANYEINILGRRVYGYGTDNNIYMRYKVGQNVQDLYNTFGATIGATVYPDNTYEVYLWERSNYRKIFDFHERQISGSITFIPPYKKCSEITRKQIRVEDIQFVDSVKPDTNIYKNGVSQPVYSDIVAYDQYSYPIGENTFINFTYISNVIIDGVAGTQTGECGGNLILFKLNEDSSVYTPKPEDLIPTPSSANYNNLGRICIKNVINNEYKGYEVDANNSTFYSFGNILQSDKNDEVIYDGDTYIQVFLYTATHAFQQDVYSQDSVCTIYAIPIQSSINIFAQHGATIKDVQIDNNFLYQDYAGSMFGGKYQQSKDAYLYNTGYNVDPTLISYTPVYRSEIYTGFYDTRVKHSNKKDNGELFDNWLHFDANATLDVDTRFGQITHLKLFKDSLMFWQKDATGVLSVNERTIVQDTDNTSILLGTGGVLQRFDYITTKYGMAPNDRSETQSQNYLYWWDRSRKEILNYTVGQAPTPLTEAKNVRSYILNNRNIGTPHLAYYGKYNEIIMSVVQYIPIVYNDSIQCFTGFYDYTFTDSLNFDTDTWVTYNKSVLSIDSDEYMEAYLTYIVNKNSSVVKTFDNVRFGISSTDNDYETGVDYKLPDEEDVGKFKFRFKTAGQYSSEDVNITTREFDYRFAVPRAQVYDNKKHEYVTPKPYEDYGRRMRGKYMLTEITVPELERRRNHAISIQYIITKFRISYN